MIDPSEPVRLVVHHVDSPPGENPRISFDFKRPRATGERPSNPAGWHFGTADEPKTREQWARLFENLATGIRSASTAPLDRTAPRHLRAEDKTEACQCYNCTHNAGPCRG